MLAAIASAAVGDEQRREDPTVNALQERAAELLGQEAALFVPTATMANQIALKLHSRPGDVLVAERYAHVVIYEYGGAAAHAGLMIETIDGRAGRFGAAELEAVTVPSTKSADQRPTVLAIENTHNSSGGRCWPLDELRSVTAAARERGLRTHLDGARLLNASIATGVPAAETGRLFDTVTLCLSKGLGCPLGALLAGSAATIERAWREKHLFGGAMRQAGIVAAAGVYALDHNVDRLADDHLRARRLAQGWHAAGLPVDLDQVETNFVQLDVGALGLGRDDALSRLRASGVGLSSTVHPTLIRAVTHLDVDDEAIERRDRARAAGARCPCRRLRAWSSDSRASLQRRSPSSAFPRSARPCSATARSSGVRRSGRPTSSGGGGDGGPRLPDRLDHEDVHGRLHPPATRRDGARSRRPAADARPRGASRADRPGRALAPERPPARASGRHLGDARAADARRPARGARGRRARPAPGRGVALLEPRVRAPRRDRGPAERRPLRGCAPRARPRPARALAHGVRPAGAMRDRLLRRPVLRPRHGRGRPGRRRADRRDGLALVDGRRPRPLGGLSRDRAGRRPLGRDARRDGPGADDGRPGDVVAGLGARARAVPARRPRLRRARRGDAGVPRRRLRPPPRAHRGCRVVQQRRRGAAGEPRARARRGGARRASARTRGVARGRRRAGRCRAAARSLVVGGLGARALVERRAASAGARGGTAQAQRVVASARGRRIAGGSWRGGSSGSCSG